MHWGPCEERCEDHASHGERRRMRRFGHHHGGHGRGGGRRGALRLLVLDLIRERPRHGYDVIKAMEERSRGMYSPSPGSIYPVLQMLEDQGFVRGREDEGRRVYEITEEGEAHLRESGDKVRHHWHRVPGRLGPEVTREGKELLDDLRGLFGGIASAVWRSAGDPAKIRSIREVLRDAEGKVDDIAGPEAPSEPGPDSGRDER